MKKVMIFYSNRAEEGLILPVAKELLNHTKDIETIVKVLPDSQPRELLRTYEAAFSEIVVHEPDLVLLGFDRVQMLMAAIATMVNGVPLAQMHAGDLAGPDTWDDKVRYAITSMADLIFCNGKESYTRIYHYIDAIDRIDNIENIHEVGSTAFDDVNILAATLPKKGSFDLVLYNPPNTQILTGIGTELRQIQRYLNRNVNRTIIWIGPNGDAGSQTIENFVMNLKKRNPTIGPRIVYHKKLPRASFLGHMSRAARLIGNSSAFWKEGPLYMDEDRIINIGTRNKDRKFTIPVPGGSKKIVHHIMKYLVPMDYFVCVACDSWVHREMDKCSQCGKSYPGVKA